MTKEEFISKHQYLNLEKQAVEKRFAEIMHEREALRESYQKEVFERSGYHIGQKVTDNEGRVWFVSGTSLHMPQGDVYLVLNFAKKDGTMSKVSGMGRGMPNIKIG